MNTCAKSQTVWATNPESLLKLDPADPGSVFRNTSTTDACLDMTTQGWIKVGTAEVLYTLDRTPEGINADTLAALHAAEQKLQADTEVKLNALREMRSKLQALSWNGEAAKPSDWQDVISEEGWRRIKTGCGLMIDDDFYWGDLFRRGDMLLYNMAADTPQGSADHWGPNDPSVLFDPDSDNFQTSYRGLPRLVVCSVDAAAPNFAIHESL